MDCSSVHGISQATILEWVAFSFSGGSSPPRDYTCIFCIGRHIIYHWATREAHSNSSCSKCRRAKESFQVHYLHQPVINRKQPKPSRNLFSCADITLPLTILFQRLICQHRLWKVNWSCRFSSAPTSNNSTMLTCFHTDVGLPISASLGSHYFHWVPRLQ